MNPSLALARRRFLSQCALGVGALAVASSGVEAVDPPKRSGTPRLLLSLAAYSFRNYLKDTNHARDAQPEPGRTLDLFQFVDYCGEHQCAGAELTSYYFPTELEDDFLIRLRRHCFLRGVAVSGSAVGNNFTHPLGEKRTSEIASVKKWIDRAALLGAPHIRVFAGNPPAGTSRQEATKLCLDALEECGDYAGHHGIFLGIENHGGIVAESAELLDLVRTVRSPWIGINLDTGNFHTDDPYRDLELCAPYAVNVQMKSEVQRRGQKKEEADLGRFVKILRAANYQGYVALEYEAAEDPWKAVPPILEKMHSLFGS